MVPVLFALDWVQCLAGTSLLLVALFLILLVMVQRGRGGGLSGAFGGMGGQSAFGTKAGDVFTKITVVTAFVWILLCILWIVVLNRAENPFGTPSGGTSGQIGPVDPAEEDVDQ